MILSCFQPNLKQVVQKKKGIHVYVLAKIKTLRKNSATISVEPFKVIAFDVAVAAMINFPADVISFY